jgi:RNA polymerase sigma factor (sigma-70 family)
MQAATAIPHVQRRPGRFVRSLSDERLVSRVRACDEAAFEAIYDRHHRGLLSFCRHMLGSQQEAEDAVQHTFIAAYRSLISGDRDIQLKAWLYAIARNKSLSVLRARREHVPLDDVQPATEGLAAEVERRQDLKDLLTDLQALPEEQRAALVLSEIGAHTHDEIGVILDVPKQKVKALVFQARTSIAGSRDARETPCEVVQEQLATLHGGALRRNQIRMHVTSCPACQAFKAETQRQRAAMAIVLPVVPALSLKSGILGATTASAASGIGGMGGGGAGAAAVAGGATAGGGSAVFGGGVVASGLAAVAGKSLLTKGLVTAAVAATAVGAAGGGGYLVLKDPPPVKSERAQARTSTVAKASAHTPTGVAGGIGLPVATQASAKKSVLERVVAAGDRKRHARAHRPRTHSRHSAGSGPATGANATPTPTSESPAAAGAATDQPEHAKAPNHGQIQRELVHARNNARREQHAIRQEQRRQTKAAAPGPAPPAAPGKRPAPKPKPKQGAAVKPSATPVAPVVSADGQNVDRARKGAG